jgi:hypothetical protein
MEAFWRAGLLGVVLASLFGCSSLPWFGDSASPHRVSSVDQAGSLHIAVLSVEPWDLAKPTLSPNFSLPANNALTAVLPTTANASSALIEAITTQLAAQAAFGKATLPSASSSSTQGSAATVSGPSTPAAVATPPAVTDPFQQYDAANSLYQKVQLINRQVQAAALRYNFRPYIVGLQLRIEPYARNEPYDAYADLSFFTQTHYDDEDEYYAKLKDINADVAYAPVVVPLLATESLVNTQTTASVNRSNQFEAALTALAQSATGTLNFQSLIDAINQINAPSLTSVETIARHTDNTIRVRMGATISPDFPTDRGTYVMQSRSYDVTLLLLAPAKWDNASHERNIHVVTGLELRDAITGELVPSARTNEIEKRLVAVFDAQMSDEWRDALSERKRTDDTPIGAWAASRFEDIAKHQCPDFTDATKTPKDNSRESEVKRAFISYLYDRVIDNAQRCFIYAMDEFGVNISSHQYLWQALAAFGSTYGKTDAMLRLPPQHDPVPPPSQRVILFDNKSTASGQLVGGRYLSATNLVVRLIGKAPSAVPIYATTVTSPDEKTLQFSFPSLTGVCGSMTADGAGGAIDPAAHAVAIYSLNKGAAAASHEIEAFLGENSSVFHSDEKLGTDKADFGTLALQLLPFLSPIVNSTEGHVPADAAGVAMKLITLVRALSNHHPQANEDKLASALAKIHRCRNGTCGSSGCLRYNLRHARGRTEQR